MVLFLFVYVDNSNVWIEGGHIKAARLGLATDPLDAARRRVTPRWAYDFGQGRLLEARDKPRATRGRRRVPRTRSVL